MNLNKLSLNISINFNVNFYASATNDVKRIKKCSTVFFDKAMTLTIKQTKE